ncbi:MAG: hypothetical protein ACYC5O_18090 [Anaerolineae bacterium]
MRDLMILPRLGLRPGDTLPAREMYALLFDRISKATEICGWGDMKNVTSERLCCGGATSGDYERAIEWDLLGAAPKWVIGTRGRCSHFRSASAIHTVLEASRHANCVEPTSMKAEPVATSPSVPDGEPPDVRR